MRGRSIRIFLSDGNVTGIRHAEVVNWTGQAIVCPRNKISELNLWPEVKRPGIYFLFGEDEVTSLPNVYVGEAENVLIRLQSHIANKDYWNEVIVFSNKDENLTKGHVKYLESRLIEISTFMKRYKIENANAPQLSQLPRGDKESMEEFIENIRILLGALGHKLLEPLVLPEDTSKGAMLDVNKEQIANKKSSTTKSKRVVDTKVFMTIGNIVAAGITTNEGIVVFKGSLASKKEYQSIAPFLMSLRERLILQGILIDQSSNYVFAQDYLFTSPTSAACIIAGYSINGRECWKNEQGLSIKELEEGGVLNEFFAYNSNEDI